MKKRYGSVGYAEDTPFNSSMAYLERLERRWEDADDAKAEGNMIAYFRTLHTIYMNTHPFFTDEEQESVVKQITKCDNEVRNGEGKMDPQAMSLIITDIEHELDALRMTLVRLLFKYKITYFVKEKKGWEEQVVDDYA